MKKIFVALLCLVVILYSLSACTGEQNQEQHTTGEPAASGTTEQITLTIGLPQNIKVEDYDTNAFTLWLEEKTGYNLEFMTFTSAQADYKTQLATRLDRLPDILWNMDLGSTTIRSYGKDEYFLDLSEYFEDQEKSSVFWERMAQLPEDFQETIKLKMVDKETGAIYGVPRVEYTLIDTMDYQVYINQTWLDNLGLQMPTDPDSLFNVLMAFKEKDANGNGDPNDELPLVGFEKGYCGDVINWIVNMFIYADDNTWWNVDESGRLYSPFTTEEYRNALRYINKLVKNGLLSDTAWAGSHVDLKPLLNVEEGQPARVGVWLSHPTTVLEVGNSIALQYEAMPQWGNVVLKENVVNIRTFITDACQNPDAAWNLLMTMCSEEGSMRMRYGEYGEDWTEADSGTKSFLGMDAQIKILNEGAFSAQGNQTWGAIDSTILIYAESETAQMPESSDAWTTHKMKMMGDCYNVFVAAAKNNPADIVPPLIYSESEAELTRNERDNCQAWIKQCRSQFGAGIMNVDDDKVWANYLSQLEKMGLETWRTQAQQIYEAQTGR